MGRCSSKLHQLSPHLHQVSTKYIFFYKCKYKIQNIRNTKYKIQNTNISRATGSSSEEIISRPIQVFFNPNISIKFEHLNGQTRFSPEIKLNPGQERQHICPAAPQVRQIHGSKKLKLLVAPSRLNYGNPFHTWCKSYVGHNLQSILLSHGFSMVGSAISQTNKFTHSFV